MEISVLFFQCGKDRIILNKMQGFFKKYVGLELNLNTEEEKVP